MDFSSVDVSKTFPFDDSVIKMMTPFEDFHNTYADPPGCSPLPMDGDSPGFRPFDNFIEFNDKNAVKRISSDNHYTMRQQPSINGP